MKTMIEFKVGNIVEDHGAEGVGYTSSLLAGKRSNA